MPLDDTVWTDTAAATALRRCRRRDDDQRLAALLVEGGIPADAVYAVPDDEVEDCVLSDDGQWAEEWGRPLRRWSGYQSQAHAAQTRRALFYAAFAAQQGINRVRQIRISAPVCSVPLTTLRSVHAETSRRVAERLRYGIARYAPGIAVDQVTAEVKRDGAWRAYLHFHIVTRGGTPAEVAALLRYWTMTRGGLQNGWGWWDSETAVAEEGEDDRTERHPAALINYVSKGLAAAISDDDWTPEELAELYRQTRGVALIRAKGDFARWLGDLDRAGLTVRRGDYGVAEIIPKRPQRLGVRRHRERLFLSAGFSILRRLEEYDFGDGIRRRAWLVRGHARLTIGDINAVYLLGEAPLTEDAPIPESPPLAPPGHPQSLALLRPPDQTPGAD